MINTDSRTEWMLFQCERGNQWSSVTRIDTQSFTVDPNGQLCYFSGCTQDHTIKQIKVTTDRHEAHVWFRNANREVN